MLQILDPKNGFQVKFQTPKNGTHTPMCKYGEYPSWADGIVSLSHNITETEQYCQILPINFKAVRLRSKSYLRSYGFCEKPKIGLHPTN